jgi:hypothetical protein
MLPPPRRQAAGAAAAVCVSSLRHATDPQLRAVFDRLAPRIGRKRAIIAVARRRAIALRRRWLHALREQHMVTPR